MIKCKQISLQCYILVASVTIMVTVAMATKKRFDVNIRTSYILSHALNLRNIGIMTVSGFFCFLCLFLDDSLKPGYCTHCSTVS